MSASQVSVIIPVFNRADLVRQAVDSVLAQTRAAAEILVVDDGSSDDVAGAVAGLAGVRYLRQERQGSAVARTHGLGAARGDVIASLDSDDLWHPEFLQRSLARLEAGQLDLVFANWVSDRGPSHLELMATPRWQSQYCRRRDGDWWLLDAPAVRRMALENCPAPSSAFLLRRSSMPAGWNPELQIADDWYLLLETVLSRPCRAAFTFSKLWTKRIDGLNKYDGRAAVDVWRELHVHDGTCFLRDFRSVMTGGERARLTVRLGRRRSELQYLRLRRGLRTMLAPASSPAR